MKTADIIAMLIGVTALASLVVRLGSAGAVNAVPDRTAELRDLCERQRSVALIVGSGVIETLRRKGEADGALAARIAAAAAREDNRALVMPAFDRYLHSEEGRVVVAEGVRLRGRIGARPCPPVENIFGFQRLAERSSPVLVEVMRDLRLPPFIDPQSRGNTR